MIYLGIHNSWQSGAALIINGKIIGAVTEERFNRVKNFHGMPINSINYLLDLKKLKLKDIDKIVYGMVTSIEPDEETLKNILQTIINGTIKNSNLKSKFYERVTSEMLWNKKHLSEVYKWLNTNKLNEKINFIDHHLSHSAGAYYSSPFDKCLVFTCDGKGNYKSSSLSIGNKNDLKLINYNLTFESIGYFYGTITKALGFQAERHEGKVTGLAAYGSHSKFQKITDSIIKFENGFIKANLGDYYLPWLCDEKDLPLLYKEVRKYKKEDVALAAQSTIENVICNWVEYSIKKHNANKLTNICLSGGVFGNVKLNQKIREIKKVKNIFVKPAMGDMGIPLGSCFAQMAIDRNYFKKYVKSMDLGPSFNSKEITKELKKRKYKFNKIKFIAKEIADLLRQNKVIGFFKGRMEFGPRALCNRSIIYHCKDKSVNHWLNKRLNRTEFMPFAPVTTFELASKCFVDWKKDHFSSDFMTVTYNVTSQFKKKCPACVHVDGTARPQIIRKENDPLTHKIISYINKEYGDLALINTSFNNHEEPIVCSPGDAIDSLERGNIDVLVIEDYLVEKFN